MSYTDLLLARIVYCQQWSYVQILKLTQKIIKCLIYAFWGSLNTVRIHDNNISNS